MKRMTRFDRLWRCRALQEVKRIKKTNGILRTWLYTKTDRQVDKMRHGLKELRPDVIAMRRNKRTVPDCPKYRWV